MTVSQGKVVRDGRRLPFFAVTKAAMAALRAEFEGGQRKTGIAIYATLIERSNDEGSDSFTAARSQIAADAGVHPSTLTEFADRLAKAGLLSIERRKEGSANLPNLWTLTDPPLLVSGEYPSSSQASRGRTGRGPSSPQPTEAVVSGEDPSSPETRPFKERTEEQEAAATAAAASSSSSTDKSGDIGAIFWSRALIALTVAGFTADEVETDSAKVKALLRRSAALLPAIDWPVLGAQLKAGRDDGSIYTPTPTGVLAFGLNQRGDDHLTTKKGPAKPAALSSSRAAAKDGIVLPEPDEQTAGAWRDVMDGLQALPKWDEVSSRAGVSNSMLTLVRPLRLNGNVLEISAGQDDALLIEMRLVPIADAFARERLNGRVCWVDRSEAAARQAVAA